MSRVIFDAATIRNLVAAGTTFEVHDQSGQFVARYARIDVPPLPPAGYEIEGEWPSHEEVERRMREGNWHTTAEVLAHLKSLNRGS